MRHTPGRGRSHRLRRCLSRWSNSRPVARSGLGNHGPGGVPHGRDQDRVARSAEPQLHASRVQPPVSGQFWTIALKEIRMSRSFSFTSESVSEGHPDKVADQISDAILDAILAQDKYSRVAAEPLCNTGLVVLAGEITTSAWVDVEALVRKTVCGIGYDSGDLGYD